MVPLLLDQSCILGGSAIKKVGREDHVHLLPTIIIGGPAQTKMQKKAALCIPDVICMYWNTAYSCYMRWCKRKGTHSPPRP